ncbi:MAG: hypothetical protein HOV68_08500 [Streptomycetaceae bacterium]|nr:hypothetical protein [Streptomycetaceae bacterium]
MDAATVAALQQRVVDNLHADVAAAQGPAPDRVSEIPTMPKLSQPELGLYLGKD